MGLSGKEVVLKRLWRKYDGASMSGKSELAGVVKERKISMWSCQLSLDRECSRMFGSVLTSQVMALLS